MTKGKSVSKRLTLLSVARNLTSRQEHQLVALADRARKMERALAQAQERPSVAGTAWVDSLPCPDCGQFRVLCYLLKNEEGEHMHTHYVCTFWGSGQPKACGYHGWTVPGWEGADS
jgi:hypothetical protein